MPFRPDRTQPDFADLITSLNNSRNQIKDNPLYQTIFILLQRITTSRNNIVKQLEDIDELVNDLLSATYLTVDDESAQLVNSRKLLAGTNITFDDTTPHERTINSSGGGGITTGGNTPPFFTYEEFDTPQVIEFLGNFPIVASSSVAQDGYWAPLTDGDVDETDIIFADGEAVMVFVPL
jgi:Leucine-rich repeat (LRR) protein